MRVLEKIKDIRKYTQKAKNCNKSIGFVPTMGYLHDGHLSLVREAKKKCDVVVVSIFVNPMQFGPKEDLKKYPRNLKRDKKLLSSLNIDVLFIPNSSEILKNISSFIEVGELSNKLCGKSRPEHFRGVATIVAKLFNIVNPDIAFFGKKDFQQLQIIRKMTKDLGFNVDIIGIPIIREKDGLAMSSRNSYLSKKQRKSAVVLYKSLKLAKNLIFSGEINSNKIKQSMKALIAKQIPKIKIDYIAICDPTNFEPKKKINAPTLIAVAAFAGKTRLIDNVVIRI